MSEGASRSTPTAVELARSAPGREIASKLEWLMLFRVLMVTVLLGAAILSSADTVASLSEPFHLFLYGIIIATYGLTLGYAIAVRRVRDVVRFAYVQLAGDVAVSACLVHVTGGTESVFTFLFSLSIINGAIVLYRQGALTVATLSSVAFLMIGGHEAGWIRLPELEPRLARGSLYYVTFIHLTTFYLVAILASYLAEQLRRAGQEIDQKTLDIAELRALNDNIVRSLSSGLVTVDRGGRILSFNEGAARVTGWPAEDVLLKPLQEGFPELADLLTFEGSDPELMRLETTYTRRDNARIILQYTVSPLRGHDGASYGKVVHFEDATQMHALESAVKRHERLAAVGELAAAIAHEIRNPLASISGSVEMLGSVGAEAGESRGRLLDIVMRETERLDKLITDFLGYARPQTPEPSPTDMGPVVRETVEAFRRSLPSPDDGAAVVVEVEDAGDTWASVDGGQIRQVLWNLLRNAEVAMPEGGRITVSLVRERVLDEGHPDLVWVRVGDQGPGISPAILDRIFDPFYTTRKEGTGLGLAICQRIVEDHDGDLSVTCPEEGGAVFSMRLRAASPGVSEAVA